MCVVYTEEHLIDFTALKLLTLALIVLKIIQHLGTEHKFKL